MLTRNSFNVADLRATKIYDVYRVGSQWPWFEPEHLVDSMVLESEVNGVAITWSERGHTFNSATSVIRPRGPANELSKTNVFAPFTC